MDRRKLKSRSGLHRGLQSSQASTKDDEVPLSGSSCASSVKRSQKISNTEKLRERLREMSNLSETSQSIKNKTESVKKKSPELRTSSKQSLENTSGSDEEPEKQRSLSKSSRRGIMSPDKRKKNSKPSTENASDSNGEPENKRSPVKPSKKKEISPDKSKKSARQITENASDSDREIDDRPSPVKSPKKRAISLDKRKKNSRQTSASDSDQEPVKQQSSGKFSKKETISLDKRKKISKQTNNVSDTDGEPEKQYSPLRISKKKIESVNKRKKSRLAESASDSNEEVEERQRSAKLSKKQMISPNERKKNSAKENKPISSSTKISDAEMSPQKRKRNISAMSDSDSNQENITVCKKTKISNETASSSMHTITNKLEDFFKQSGIKLSQDDDPHELDDNPLIVVKKMSQLFFSAKFKADEITTSWKEFMDDEQNLLKALKDMVIVINEQPTNTNFSLIRIILQVPQIQTIVADHLLQKLNETVLTADLMDDVPWASLLLQQFRFLEIVVDSDSLTMRLEELLETCPIWFQRELILFLPDIVVDIQHNAIAEMLSKLMEAHVDLTNTVLECITNLTLGKEYQEELREKILQMLKRNLVIELIPSIVRFVLYECPSIEVCEKVLSVVRCLELQPLSGENAEEYFKNQALLVNELKMSILMSEKMSKAAINVVKRTTDPAKPFDLIILIVVHSNKRMRKKSEGILKQHIKAGFYRSSLLSSLYQEYKVVAKELQPDALQMASTLLKSEDQGYTDFTIDWFRLQFISQTGVIHKQREILEKMILLMGNNDQTAKKSLGILKKIVENEEEIKSLQAHCNHLRILLEKIDNFDLDEVATLSDLLYALCANERSNSQALQDDLLILLQKQLSNAKTVIKCKGVLGASMAIKHLAGKSESCKVARDIFSSVQIGVKNCPRSRALFYDQIGTVIADTKNIDEDFLRNIAEELQETFINEYMEDLNEYKGELIPRFGLNEQTADSDKCAVNFRDGKSGAVVPAFFRLLRICYMRLNDGNLEEINALLGSPILMPNESEISESLGLDLTICCINWFRELINGFVTQTDELMQEQVLKRLENLMALQAEFSSMTTTMEDPRYQPPPFYFHVFPVPAFVKVEKKITKKGKRGNAEKSINVPEWEFWQVGSLLCSKNPSYFRRLDPKVIDLLDLRINESENQEPTNITKAQICFLIKEIVRMIESSQASETLMRDLIHVLPKICSKFDCIVQELRERNDNENRHAAKLILSLLTEIFDWKAFGSLKYHSLLRDGLRTLASQMDKTNSTLRSSKELVEESYKYFESLTDVAIDISFAYSVLKMCRSLMRHSTTFAEQHKDKQASLAFGFLGLQWPEDHVTGATYKTAVVGFLSNWIRNELNPLETVTTVLNWLPDEITKLENAKDRLERMPAITKAIFHHMFQKLFEGLIAGVKIALNQAKTDPERIKVWQQVGCNVQKIVEICKNSSRSVLQPFLRSMTSLLRIFLSSGMPILEQNLRFQTEEVTGIMKKMQGGTRYLNMVCVDCTEKKDMALAKIVPPAKQLTEKLLYLVKGMLVYNNSSEAFWMGNLVNKNLEGVQISSQTSTDEPTETSLEGSAAPNSEDEANSEILESEAEEQVSDEESS